MKNFLRALRASWVYRTRLILSLMCALTAAALWGANLTVIYPVLKVLGEGQSLQEWVEQEIDTKQVQIRTLEKDLAHDRTLLEFCREHYVGDLRDREERLWTGKIVKLENELEHAVTWLWYYQTLRNYCIRYLPQDPFRTLCLLIAMVVVGIGLKGFFEFIQESLVGSVTNRTLYDIRNRFFRNVLSHDLKQFGENGSHQLMSRFTNDVEMLGVGIRTLYGKVISQPLRALSCVILACMFNWKLTLLFLVLVPLAIIAMTKVSRLMKRATKRLLEGMSQIYKRLQETFSGIQIVKSFTMEPYERRRFRKATSDYYHKSMKVVYIDSISGPIVELLGVAAVAVALLAGAYLVLNSETHLFGIQITQYPMDVAALLTLYSLLAAIADPVRKLSSVYTKMHSAAAAADRVYNYLDQKPAIEPNLTGTRFNRNFARLEFNDVCFSYEPGRSVLSHIQLQIKAGETIAIVGRNGCGKSTLLRLLPRLYDPDHGSITIDDVPLRLMNLRTLRRGIGIVTQDTFLFDDTIYANILYGKPSASREEVEAAARKAYIHDLIVNRLPKGYDTLLGEAGRTLSGGQKQKLALARTILRDPAILILDEFTSQYDTESEAQIHQTLREFMKGRTTFVITHRLNTLEVADRIVVLDEGHIVAVGTLAELLQSCSVFQQLHEASFHLKSA